MLKIEKLFKKYSTYFREFKSDAAECCCYYLFFIFRRIGIIVLAFLVPYKELQLSISVTMTLAVIDMQIIIYLIETKAYSNKMICFNIIVNEILTLVYYILLFLPLLSGLGYDKADMAAHTILLVLCALLINVAINLSSILKNIKECIVARISRRSIIHINVLPIDDSQQELH